MNPYRTLWTAARSVHAGSSPKLQFKKMRFLWRAWTQRHQLKPLFQNATPFLAETLAIRPNALGLLEWPYIHCDWRAEQKIDSFRQHHDLTNRIEIFRLPVGMRRDVCQLDEFEQGLRLVLDRPHWFLREGELSLNLFLGDLRLYTVAFNIELDDQGNMRVAVGGVQGRSVEGAKDTYARLTKSLHGARPRDFLIGSLLLACEALSIPSVRGVSDAKRHHRNHYFGGAANKTNTADYDEIWGDRGGELKPDGFFHLPAKLMEKPLEDVPSKKRAMYRRRAELYAHVRQAMLMACAHPPQLADQLPG
jgi:uncharacterized protein VirK/YbjX